MKQIIALLGAAIMTSAAIAQDNNGTIIYTQTISLNFDDHPELAAFAEMIPKEQSSKKLLYYTPTESLYKDLPKEKEAENKVSNGNGVHISMDFEGPSEIIYKDLVKNETIEQKEFMGRQFLITGDMKEMKWKMTGRQKEILKMPAQEAMMVMDKDTVLAWFTPAIPVKSGPSSLGNLPGMILEVHIGSMVEMKATSIINSVEKEQLEKPKGGKKMSQKDFEAMVKEKTKEMEMNMGGGDGKQVIIQRIER